MKKEIKIKIGQRVRILNKTAKGWGTLDEFKDSYPQFPIAYYSGPRQIRTTNQKVYSLATNRKLALAGVGNFFNLSDFEPLTKKVTTKRVKKEKPQETFREIVIDKRENGWGIRAENNFSDTKWLVFNTKARLLKWIEKNI